MANLKLIEAKTLGSNTANVTFTSIPQTYTDLKLVYSARNTTSVAGEGFDATISFNGTTANRSTKVLRGDGSIVSANTISDPTDFRLLRSIQPSDYTSSVFSNVEIYIPNYTSSNNKSFSVDTVLENNATATGMGIIAGLWSDTAAITSITLGGVGGNLLSGSTFYLYGISNVTTGSKATGGIVSYDANYYYHMFPYSGTFTPTQSLTADVLVIAGGGAGGYSRGGGGGAGGLVYLTSQSLTATGYTVTVGAGGAATVTDVKSNGSNSQFASTTAAVGGGGGASMVSSADGNSGGSGGGATSGGSVGTATSGQGNNGGTGSGTAPKYGGGGGGGFSADGGAGSGTKGGNGGDGTNAYSSWASATHTGADNGYYAGGGVGGTNEVDLPATPGLGGGGSQIADYGLAGKANTGGGGGSGMNSTRAAYGGAGGSGIVIIRYAI